MKTQRRHELKQNQLADWLGHKIAWAEQNSKILIGAVLGVVVVAGLIAYYNHSRTERQTTAWSDYLNALEMRDPVGQLKGLEDLANAESGTVPGQLAQILLGDIALNEGIDQLNTDRAAAEKKLTEAKGHYSEARAAASDEKLKERATLGLARYYETMGLIEDATREYRLLADNASSLYHDDAQRKLEYLGKPATLYFAKWYRERKPGAPEEPSKQPTKEEVGKLPADESSFPKATATATATATPSATPSASPTATAKPTPSPSPTASPTAK